MTESARIPKYAPASLDEAQRSLYDAIAGGRRAQGPQLFRLVDDAGRLEGPFNAFLLQPGVGSALQAARCRRALRDDPGDRAREIAILVVAAVWQCDFEVYAHEAVGRSVGLTDAELDGIRSGTYDSLTKPMSGSWLGPCTHWPCVATSTTTGTPRPSRPSVCRAVRGAHARRLLRDPRSAAARVPGRRRPRRDAAS